jgi:PAS domain S-box-containing protein
VNRFQTRGDLEMSTARIPMSRSEMPAPPEFPGGDNHRDHTVQFYADDAVLLDGLSRFIGDAITAGGAALVVATAAHQDGLARRLQARGLHIASAVERGRLIQLDADKTLSKFMLEGWPDPARFSELIGSITERARQASEVASAPLAVFGEMVALLWAQGKFDAAIRLEQLWNEMRETHSFSLRCAYPMTGFDREDHAQPFLKICAEHSHVIPGESYMGLTTDEERFRNISRLQQRAQALDNETSERREAQRALKGRESELADLLENALEGVQRTGPDQRIMWANKALLKLLGYSPEEYVGHYLADFFKDPRAYDEFWTKLINREEIYDYAAELKRKDGDIAHVVIRSNALWEDGKLIHTRTFIHDVTERRAMELALKQAHDELEARVRERTDELRKKNIQILKQAEILDLTNQGLRELSARLMRVQDDERRRIARDLHDSTGQALALLSMNLSVLESEARKSNPGLVKGLVENATIVRQVSSELRTLSYLLHPPLLEEMGLESALRWYIDGFGQRSNITVALELPPDLGRLPRDFEIAIYRVIQECLTNIHRHSDSPTASIRVSRCSGGINLRVKDEGKGIEPERLAKIKSSGAPGVGLRGMRERIKDLGGEVEIESDGKGTEITVAIPVDMRAPKVQFPEDASAINA